MPPRRLVAPEMHYFDNTPISTQPDVSSSPPSHSSGGDRSRVHLSKPNELYRTCDECANEIIMIRRALFEEPNSVVNQSDEDNTNGIKYTSRERTHQLPCSSSTTSLIRRNQDGNSDSNLCPVCATDLLKEYISDRKNVELISNDDFEKFKEQHINECLVAFDFNTDHSTRFSPESNPRNKMLVYNIPPIPKPQYENIGVAESASASLDTSLLLPQEKVEEEECVICLEDLKPGDKVGRLECLCVFHYKCIKDWFNKKGYGECPVHFLHK
ncbi:hypothetical protein CANMA_001744 [Candida margitis]|uniref:uncharacterized protein n=1 Tax=Candida margitis TaxID=1775924 RepID=UPI0022275B7E|nr:uncharacterized protein CANMA_001744 [Candida margitis]KAI5969191.1 hypothetical protein CANMA_001744 [Candida margitis]